MDEVKWTRPWSLTSFAVMLLKECVSYRLKVTYCTANDLSFSASSFERKIKTDMKKINFESVWSVENTAYAAFILALCTNLLLCEITIFLIVSYLLYVKYHVFPSWLHTPIMFLKGPPNSFFWKCEEYSVGGRKKKKRKKF